MKKLLFASAIFCALFAFSCGEWTYRRAICWRYGNVSKTYRKPWWEYDQNPCWARRPWRVSKRRTGIVDRQRCWGCPNGLPWRRIWVARSSQFDREGVPDLLAGGCGGVGIVSAPRNGNAWRLAITRRASLCSPSSSNATMYDVLIDAYVLLK